ncbi:MAG: N-acetylmuramoyl-L-alanine amidase [archaeon]
MKMFGKRAQLLDEVYLVIFELLLLGVCGYGLLQYVDNMVDDTHFEKTYMSRDLALLTGTILSSPGNIYYAYGADTSPFNVRWADNGVEVYEDGDIMRISRTYLSDSSVALPEITVVKNRVGLAKEGARFLATPSLKRNINLLSCPGIDTRADTFAMKVAIDPGHGATDPGLINPDLGIREADLMYGIASVMTAGPFRQTFMTRGRTEDKTPEERLSLIAADSGLLISLHAGTRRGVIAYIPDRELVQHQKLACNILNSILEEFPDTAVTIAVSDDPLLYRNSGLAVQLEIGNIIKPGLLENPNLVARRIIEGIKKHYE